MSDPYTMTLHMAGDPRFPGHTDEFKRIMDRSTIHQGQVQGDVRVAELEVSDLMNVRDDELVLLSRFGGVTNMPVDAEIARRNVEAAKRNEEALKESRSAIDRSTAALVEFQRESRTAIDRSTAALVEFRQQSATASDRLESLTRWLIAFTCAVVLLTVVLVVHDLTR